MEEGTELFDDRGSVEHISPESNGCETLNIGNLILLENDINQQAGEREYVEKKEYYKNSKYKEVISFYNEHDNWEINNIGDRAKEMARRYYTGILGISQIEK